MGALKKSGGVLTESHLCFKLKVVSFQAGCNWPLLETGRCCSVSVYTGAPPSTPQCLNSSRGQAHCSHTAVVFCWFPKVCLASTGGWEVMVKGWVMVVVKVIMVMMVMDIYTLINSRIHVYSPKYGSKQNRSVINNEWMIVIDATMKYCWCFYHFQKSN